MNIDNFYEEIAKKRNLTEQEVKQEIQECIQRAYQNKDRTLRMIEMQNKVPRKGEIPTVDEFLTFVITEMIKLIKQE